MSKRLLLIIAVLISLIGLAVAHQPARSSSGGGRVYTAFINPQLHSKVLTSTSYSHESLLRLNEELLGVPLLGGAASAADIKPALGLSGIQRVILVMEENHASSAVTASSMPYLVGLANTYAHTTETSPCLPSLPNYIDLTSGSTQGLCGTDCSPASGCQTAKPSIFQQVGSTTWRVWAESEPSNCDHSNSGNYAVRHTAAPYYTAIATACKQNDTGYPAAPTVTGSRFTLIAPNLCNDAHDCSLGTADNWLKQHLPTLMGRKAWKAGSVLIEVTFDSD